VCVSEEQKPFPIKKRINTELFIDKKNRGLYIQKWFQKLSGLIKEGKWFWRENKILNENKSGSLFGMTYLQEEEAN